MKIKGFTLIELMVVVVIVGIIAGFALPQYQKAVRKSLERDAIAQLTAIHAASIMYRAVNDSFWVASNQNVANINTNLNLNVIQQPNMSFTYTSTAPGTTFTARAAYVDGSNNFTIEIDQGAIDNNNPQCVGGTCPSL